LQSGWFSNLTLPSAPVAIQTLLAGFAGAPVCLMMRATAFATKVAETKHGHSKKHCRKLERPDGRRRGAFDPSRVEVMTKPEHKTIAPFFPGSTSAQRSRQGGAYGR